MLREGGRYLLFACGLALFVQCGADADSVPPGGSGGAAGAGGSEDSGIDASLDASDGQAGTGATINPDGAICLTECSADLHSILNCDGTVQKACLGSLGCDPQTLKCGNACVAAENAKRSIGCEYYAVFMDQLDANACFAVFVANTWNVAANITVEYDGQPLPVANFGYTTVGKGPGLSYVPLGTDPIAPGKVAVLFLSGPDGTPGKDNPVCPKPSAVPSGPLLFNASGKGQAFRITSDVPVVAYQINPYGGGAAAVTGASLLIPTSAWDKTYMAMHAYDSGPQITSLNIVAKEPTAVTILPKKPIVGGGGLLAGQPGMPYTVNLNAGEHMQLSQLDSLDGSLVEADKPIGFFAGARCSQVPNNVYACDHLEQMLPPVQALGHEYAAVSHKPRSGEPAFWRMMGIVDGTQLTYSSDIGGPTTLSAGQIVQFQTHFPFVVKSQDDDHPFVLMAHMTGGSTNNMNGVGDADAVLSVPPSQYLQDYVFFTDPTYPITNLVVVRAKKDGQFHDVDLDCWGKLGPWKAVGDYEYYRVDMTVGDFQGVGGCDTGPHRMKSDAPFGLWVWGWGSPQTTAFTEYVSYGYPAGMNIQLINKVVVEVPK